MITSSGERVPMTDPRVTVLLPSMGKIASESLAAVLCGLGFNAKPLPPADETILKLGRGNTSLQGMPAAHTDNRHTAPLYPQ